MSSAEPQDAIPRMRLERVVELGEPIIELGVNERTTEDPLIVVSAPVGGRKVVHANTGAPYTDGFDRLFRRRGFGSTEPVAITGLVATIEGRDIVVRETPPHNRERRRFTAHTTSINVVGTCGSLLMTASDAGNIRLWEVRTGKEVCIGAQQSPVTWMVSYTGPDKQPRIASGGPDGNLHIWDPQIETGPRIGPVSTRGFSDRVAGNDLLDRFAFVLALVQVLKPGDDGPTVLTVEGAWGSGKSTLLEFVRKALLEILHAVQPEVVPRGRKLTVAGADRLLYRQVERVEVERKPPDKQLVASFNPWRHQSSEQVWAGLATEVAAAAEPALMPDPNAKERYWFTRNVDRVDRRHLQRQLWKRIYSPLLSFAGLGLALSVFGALSKLNLAWEWAFWPSVGLAGLGLLHTARRYFFGRASAFLPGELFAGPVTFSGPNTDPVLRDPYYQARSGYLYLVQHDVKALLDDLADRRYQLVVLIDDLDRCTPRTTAQVFEAINVFLSDDFPATRFVLGLDTSVVASHVDHAYKELADAKVIAHPDDPSPGWTFLRKLVQLPVRLPRTTEDSVDAVLLAQLGEVHSEQTGELPGFVADSPAGTDVLAEQPRVEEIERVVVAIERQAEVRDHLRRRLKAQPEQSVREEKRLLNVWQFYLRVLGSSDVREACHLVAVAEIATRWPAYLHRLRGGWQDLADAVGDDVQWGATVARLGFAHDDRKAASNLRKLLLDCDAQAVAGLAGRLF